MQQPEHPLQMAISIGNSDDRLTQVEWAKYVADVDIAVRTFAIKTHFFGAPPNNMPWQNILWLVDIDDPTTLIEEVTRIRKEYRQDFAYILVGEGQFI